MKNLRQYPELRGLVRGKYWSGKKETTKRKIIHRKLTRQIPKPTFMKPIEIATKPEVKLTGTKTIAYPVSRLFRARYVETLSKPNLGYIKRSKSSWRARALFASQAEAQKFAGTGGGYKVESPIKVRPTHTFGTSTLEFAGKKYKKDTYGRFVQI